MNKIQLTIEELNQIRVAAAELKGCDKLEDGLSIDLHRTGKKVTAKLKDLEDDMDALRTKHKDAWRAKKGNAEISDEELFKLKAFTEPLQKELNKLFDVKHECEVHLLKRSRFGAINELGTRKVILQTREGAKEEGAVKSHENTVYYKDHFLALLDLVILEDADYDEALNPSKK